MNFWKFDGKVVIFSGVGGEKDNYENWWKLVKIGEEIKQRLS